MSIFKYSLSLVADDGKRVLWSRNAEFKHRAWGYDDLETIQRVCELVDRCNPKLPLAEMCGMCNHYAYGFKSYSYCPNCGRQLRAGA